jgi:integrase
VVHSFPGSLEVLVHEGGGGANDDEITRRELRRILTTIDNGAYADPGKMRLGAWLQQWLEEARHSVAPNTLPRYREIVDLHLVPVLGVLPLAKLQPAHVQIHYSQALVAGRRNGKRGLLAQAVVHHHRVLHVALKRARALRLISTNPVEDASRPVVQRHEIEALEPAESAALLNATRATRMFPIIFLALATGLRRGEVLGLRWCDVDLDRRTLTVVQSLEQTKSGLRFKTPKTKRSRRKISLSPSLMDELKAYRVKQAAERLALGMGRDPSSLVSARIDGDPVQPDSVTKMFARIAERAKIRPIRFHGLRHTHATDLLGAGVHPKIASERLGQPPSLLQWTPIAMRFQACRKMRLSLSTRRSEAPFLRTRVATGPVLAGTRKCLSFQAPCRVSTVVVQRFCNQLLPG